MLKILPILIILSFIFSNPAYDIVKDMSSQDLSSTTKTNFRMKTISKKGDIKRLDFTSWSKNENNNQKQLIWFTLPRSYKGISFLKIQEDNITNMTMWHPKYKKIRKISSQDTGNSFMNSELIYEDLYIRNIDHYNYKLIKEETINKEICHLIESSPKDQVTSNYLKHQTWISAAKIIPIKEISYNLEGIPYKEKVFYYNNQNKIDSIKIHNLKKDRYTILIVKSIDTESDIKDNIFSERNLKRILE